MFGRIGKINDNVQIVRPEPQILPILTQLSQKMFSGKTWRLFSVWKWCWWNVSTKIANEALVRYNTKFQKFGDMCERSLSGAFHHIDSFFIIGHFFWYFFLFSTSMYSVGYIINDSFEEIQLHYVLTF